MSNYTDEALIAETEALILEAWGTAEVGERPAPLVDRLPVATPCLIDRTSAAALR